MFIKQIPRVFWFLLQHSVHNDRWGYLTPHVVFHTLLLVLERHNRIFTSAIEVEGTASELPVLPFEHGQMEVILSRTRDVSINVLFVPTINSTYGVNAIVVNFDKVVLILELVSLYHSDSAMIFNT